MKGARVDFGHNYFHFRGFGVETNQLLTLAINPDRPTWFVACLDFEF